MYTCTTCGTSVGITGPGSGSDDDYAAEEHYESEVEYHESGQCAPIVAAPKPDLRAEYIAGLRFLADLLEAHPSLAMWSGSEHSPLLAFAETRGQLQAWARAIPGRKDKNVTESERYGFELLGNLRGLRLQVLGCRDEVCERVVVGTREVTEMVPAPDAPLIEVTKAVEDIEWRCSPLLTEDREPAAVPA